MPKERELGSGANDNIAHMDDLPESVWVHALASGVKLAWAEASEIADEIRPRIRGSILDEVKEALIQRGKLNADGSQP
jgi:hypothetical protein